MSIHADETMSLNAVGEPGTRSTAARALGFATAAVVFGAVNAPTVAYLVSFKGASAARYAIAVAQTLSLCGCFMHAPLAVACGKSAITKGLAWYVATLLLVLGCFLVTAVVNVGLRFSGKAEETAELVLLAASLVLALLLLVVTMRERQSARGIRHKEKSFLRVNLLSWVIAAVVAALVAGGLAVDYRNAPPPPQLRFSEVMFPWSYFGGPEPSVMSILSIVFFVAAMSAVPYTLTVMRLSLDQQIEREESILNALVLMVLVCSQLVVFICSTVYIATSAHATDMDAAVVLLLLVTGVMVLRGVFYILYVGLVVSREVRGARKGPQLLSR